MPNEGSSSSSLYYPSFRDKLSPVPYMSYGESFSSSSCYLPIVDEPLPNLSPNMLNQELFSSSLCYLPIGDEHESFTTSKPVSFTTPKTPIFFPNDGIITHSWIENLSSTLDWSSRNLEPDELPSVLAIEVIKMLVLRATNILRKEPNYVKINCGINSTVVVVGDLHGQLHDALFILNDAGYPADDKYFVFNGDYVDRGAWGLETFILLLAWKVFMPHRVYLLRGNHETEFTTTCYGFEKEVKRKYAEQENLYKKCLNCFSKLPLASVIAGCVYTTHGGLFRCWSIDEDDEICLGSLTDLEKVDRCQVEPPHEGKNMILDDILWSDPSMTDGLYLNDIRGAGLLWGPDCTELFLNQNGLKLIIRSHEGPDARVNRPGFRGMAKGYTIDHVVESGRLITLFSAPDYPQFQESAHRYNNKGAYIVLKPPSFDSPLFRIFEAAPRPGGENYNFDEESAVE